MKTQNNTILRLALVFAALVLSFSAIQPVTAASWVVTGPMTTPRVGHTAALLPNGQVLVAGGYNGGIALSTAELYDPATRTWAATAALNSARGSHTATLLSNGKVLIAGGWNGSASLSSAELYDPATGMWTATGGLSTARDSHTATLLSSGQVLVAAGYGGFSGSYRSSTELYDPATGTWTAAGDLSRARESHTATLLSNGKVLVAGGYNNSAGGLLSSTELYDPATGMWAVTGSLKSARESHTATLLPNGKVLVVGGGAYPEGELYNPDARTWTATGAFTYRNSPTVTLLPNGKVLVAGGLYESGGKPELYDFVAGTWTAASPQNTARNGQTSTLLLNGQVLIAGGTGSFGGSALSSAELYAPSPDIAVEQPAGTNLSDGIASVDFGTVAIGSTADRIFTIKNTGDADLTGLAITIDGPNASDFSVTANPAAPVSGPNGSTQFTVRFARSATGSPSAALHIASNDPDENPFDVRLTASPANILSLDGVNDRAEASTSIFPDSAALHSFTVEAWIYPRAAGSVVATDDAWHLILFNQPGAGNGGVGIKFALNNSSGGSQAITEFRDVHLNQWNHVAIMFDAASKNMSIAINGIVDSPSPFTGLFSFPVDSLYHFAVGAFSGGGGNFNGYIDEVRVSDVVRYNANFTPADNFTVDVNTRALFHFSESPGSTVFGDSSPRGYSLTGLNGAAIATVTRPGGDPQPPTGTGTYYPTSDATLLDLNAQGLGYIAVAPGEAISVGENGTDQPGDRGWLAFAPGSQARADIANAKTIYLNLTPSSRIDLESANVYVDIYGLTNRTSTTASGSDYPASGVVLVGQAVTSMSPRTNLSFDVTSFVKTEAARRSSSVIVFRLQMGPSVPYLDGAFNQFNFFSAESTNTAARPTLMLNGQPRINTPMLGSAGQFQFQLFGAIRSTYIIQASTDLTTWTPIATNVIPASGVVIITDLAATNYNRRFYRAMSL